MEPQQDDLPAKRRKLTANDEPQKQASPHKGLHRPISPPLLRQRSPAVSNAAFTPTWDFDDVPKSTPNPSSPRPDAGQDTASKRDGLVKSRTNYVRSPFQLTQIKGLPDHHNVDAVGLKDILGDPMIKECWNFNYLFDLDFVMKQFDDDVRDLVSVKIIHGFWKREDEWRIRMMLQAEKYANVELLHAYLPDPFGTHHSKVLVLIRHDDCAQIIIHTANMISKDWNNMTQAVWSSPLLPLLPSTAKTEPSTDRHDDVFPIGSGERFKIDFHQYLHAYGKRLTSLLDQIADYDFSAIKAAFVGSVPSRQKAVSPQPLEQTSFGWLGLKETLSAIPIVHKDEHKPLAPHIVMQVSSIATLGAAPTWLEQFQSVLASAADGLTRSTSPEKQNKSTNIFAKRQIPTQQVNPPSPKFNIIFPTPDEIRTSLDGYTSGASIHMKLQSQQQQKQLEYMHPLFCHWKPPPTPPDQTPPTQRPREALRGPAAPHIKTYIRFSTQEHKTIDWAMVTSANLSKQAWGDVPNKKDQIWIQSWEAGVVVWPALFAEKDASVDSVMVPVFGRDGPGSEDIEDGGEGDEEQEAEGSVQREKVIVGLRMPYDLPLYAYTADEKPWCATMRYAEVDWKGQSWGGW